jgi:pyruvate, orthophosphate dikinase
MAFGAQSHQIPGGHGAHHHAVLPLDARADQPRTVIGAKGRGLADMVRIGLPVPPAFCVTSEWCERCADEPDAAIDGMWADVLDGVGWLEAQTACAFGAGPRPLLLSVRSSGVTSMPGMLETVLDVGIDDAVAGALADRHSPEFARDTRARFGRGYGEAPPPDDPRAQLRGAIAAVLASWSSSRVGVYRTHHGLPRPDRVAILVQAMIFGNLDGDSGTGVLFTRDPVSGDPAPIGEWLPGAQGDDVVSGTVDCEPIAALARQMPRVYDELMDAGRSLERLAGDVQDIEFTVESGKLWLLQTRVAQRSAQAALRLALAFRDEGIIDDAEAVDRVTPTQLAALTTVPTGLTAHGLREAPLLATGVAASPGVASGEVYTTSDAAVAAADDGRDVILVRPTTSPDDVAGMLAARGVVTETGGATSHAAIVARELGRPAVVGCGRGLSAALAGQLITVDGGAGEVRGGAPTSAGSVSETPDLRRFAEILARVGRRP